eukprot:9914158-Prorocentrum_lima.AAC.1
MIHRWNVCQPQKLHVSLEQLVMCQHELHTSERWPVAIEKQALCPLDVHQQKVLCTSWRMK